MLSRKLLAVSSGGDLYDFTTFQFNSGSEVQGIAAPTYSDLIANYDTSANPWLVDTGMFTVVEGKQLWTVPADGTYRIICAGCSGAGKNNYGLTGYATGGYGRKIEGNFALLKGQKLEIVVAKQGGNGGNSQYGQAGGGGASSVCKEGFSGTSDILIIAGGGGGGTHYRTPPVDGGHASSEQGDGSGGEANSSTGGNGGGGAFHNGSGSGYGNPGEAIRYDNLGGTGHNGAGYGGYGGGGGGGFSGGGGGGGATGGNGGSNSGRAPGATGGNCYNAGTSQSNDQYSYNVGTCTITKI